MNAQGAEAKLFTSEFGGLTVLVKERFPKRYRHEHLDRAINQSRTKAEVRNLVRCRAAGILCPTVYFVDLTSNRIYMQYYDNSTTISHYLQRLITVGDHDGISWLFSELGKIVAILHQNNIIHGDLTTSNFLAVNDKQENSASTKPRICVIDFGLSGLQHLPEDKAVDLYVLERALVSTFPSLIKQFEDAFYAAYEAHSEKASFSSVMTKLNDVRLRGRKREMIG